MQKTTTRSDQRHEEAVTLIVTRKYTRVKKCSAYRIITRQLINSADIFKKNSDCFNTKINMNTEN